MNPRTSLRQLARQLKEFGEAVESDTKFKLSKLEGKSAVAVLTPFLQLIEVCKAAPETLEQKINTLDSATNSTAAGGKERMKKAAFQVPAELYDKLLSKYVDKYLPDAASEHFATGKSNVVRQNRKIRRKDLKDVLLSLSGIFFGVAGVNHSYLLLKEALEALFSGKKATQAAAGRSSSIYEQLKAFDDYQDAIRMMCVFIYLIPSPEEIDKPPDLQNGLSRLDEAIAGVVLPQC